MANIQPYKEELMTASGGKPVRATMVAGLTAINKDGPSAETFYNLRQEGYVKGVAIPGTPYTETLYYRMDQILKKIKKTNTPTKSGEEGEYLLTTRGIRHLVGRYDRFPSHN